MLTPWRNGVRILFVDAEPFGLAHIHPMLKTILSHSPLTHQGSQGRGMKLYFDIV